MGTTISGMTGRGSIRHNNRRFSAANIDRSRTEQNVTYCNDDLKQVYHEIFDEALAAYNAKKKKTRDKITDYYEHIRQGKQEKLFHEAIFQIGNLEDCGCGSPGGERAAAALKEFAESFQERNPHLRVFNMVLHMDEATPHLHVDFIPVATEQSRGLSTRVSMKQALKQQGFVSLGRKQTEWNAWMEREKAALTEIAQAHEFEIISLGGGRPHMDLPEYRAAAQRLEAVQEQVTAAEHDMAELEKQRKALQGTVRRLQAAEKVRVDLEAIQPERTLTGAVRGVTVEQVEDLKAAAIRGTVAEHDVRELKEENRQLRSRLPSVKEQLKEAEEQQRLLNENYDLRVEVEYLTESLNSERDFSSRLLEGIGAVLDFLDRHLPEQFRPLVEKARELLPVPELQQPEQEQERGHTWGGMEL
ncbi:MAG: plasmid recombination enzyme [Faecalibacterium prausnitzii]|nr:MAG: plasmid recombination enzyme [Faecalibacterium prausnitzii]